MRTLMIITTLGAACAGYISLQSPPSPGEPYYSGSSGPRLYDWSHDGRAKHDLSRVPTKDLVYRIRQQTRSALDDFASQHGGDSNAPGDDAFQRLTQVVHAVVQSSSNPGPDRTRGFDGQEQPSLGRLPGLDDLQRKVFDPAPDAGVTGESNAARDQGRVASAKTTIAPVARSAEILVADNSEASSKGRASELISTEKVSTQNPPKAQNPAPQVQRVGEKQAAKSPSKPVVSPAPQWKVVGKTTEGRPMHSMHLGDNGTRTLVIAGLNGTDRTAVRWLELLAEELGRQPDALKGNEVVFFRAGNPDGLVRNVSNNSRDVPLNRNFPSRRYRSTSDMPSFAVPAGEVETRVMLDTLYTFRPRRVIHLMATPGPSQVLYNKPGARLATEFKRTAQVSISAMDAELLPGSLEDFADGTLEAAVLSMRLSVGNDWQRAWKTMQASVLSTVVGQSLDDEDSMFDPDRSPVPVTSVEPVSRRPFRKGYEELPAPPE